MEVRYAYFKSCVNRPESTSTYSGIRIHPLRTSNFAFDPTVCLIVLLSVMAATALRAEEQHTAIHPIEASPYDESADANQLLAQAMASAEASGQSVILVMGANWCHDSRSLAVQLTSPRFSSLIDQHFELLFIDIGTPQKGEGRNLAIAERFGVTDILGTPNVLVISTDGKLRNSADDARSWRNAASREPDEIYGYFEALGSE